MTSSSAVPKAGLSSGARLGILEGHGWQLDPSCLHVLHFETQSGDALCTESAELSHHLASKRHTQCSQGHRSPLHTSVPIFAGGRLTSVSFTRRFARSRPSTVHQHRPLL